MAGAAREIHFVTHSGSGHGWQYDRHRPERTLLYRPVEQHYPAFVEQLATCSGNDDAVGRFVAIESERDRCHRQGIDVVEVHQSCAITERRFKLRALGKL